MNRNKPNGMRDGRSLELLPKGFTLIELMVTVTIVAILAAIAIPSYSHYTLKAHRTDAKSALLDLASLEERYFSANNAYTADPAQLGYSGSPGVAFAVGSGYYNILIPNIPSLAPTAPTTALPGGTPAQYSITATATGNQTNDTECQTFTISSTGQQTATGSATATVDCWK